VDYGTSTRVEGSFVGELSSTQAAAVVLGYSSSERTEKYEYINGWSHLQLLNAYGSQDWRGERVELGREVDQAEASEAEDDDAAVGRDPDVDNDPDADESAAGAADRDDDDFVAEAVGVGDGEIKKVPAECRDDVDRDDPDAAKPVQVRHAEHYAYRGRDLWKLNAFEFKTWYHVREMKDADAAWANDPEMARMSRRGGRLVDRCLLREPHPLHKTHIIVRGNRGKLVLLTGASPPKYERFMRRKKADRFFGFLRALFQPWHISDVADEDDAVAVSDGDDETGVESDSYAGRSDADDMEVEGDSVDDGGGASDATMGDDEAPDIGGTPHAPDDTNGLPLERQSHEERFCAYYATLEHDACLRRPLPPGDDGADNVNADRKVAWGRLFAIENVVTGFKISSAPAKLTGAHDSRSRDLWKDKRRPPAFRTTLFGRKKHDQQLAQLAAKVAELSDVFTVNRRVRLSGRLAKWRQEILDALPAAVPAGSPGRGSKAQHASEWFAVGVAAARRGGAGRTAPDPQRRASARDVDAKLRTRMKPFPRIRSDDVEPRPRGRADGGDLDFDIALPAEYVSLDQATWRREYAAWRTSGEGPAPLNPQQRAVCAEVYRIAEFYSRGDRLGYSRREVHGLLEAHGRTGIVLLHGPGGTGKSHVVRGLQQHLMRTKSGRTVATAFTGVAASMFNGPTLLRLLGLNAETAKSPRPKQYRNPSDVQDLRQRFRDESGVEWTDVALFVVDEGSFLDDVLFGHLDYALRALTGETDVPCGGLPVLIVADNMQMKPVGGKAWYGEMARNSPAARHSATKGAGLRLLGLARRFNLTIIMRAVDDQDFVDGQMDLRRTGRPSPVSSALNGTFVNRIKKLSREDAEDPRRRFAPVAALSRLEIAIINRAQAERYARWIGLPLVRWPVQFARPELLLRLSAAERDEFLEAEPGMWEYFVEGAPALIADDNINSVRGLVNGSMALQDSLDFGERPLPQELRRAYADGGYCLVTLPDAPAAVNVRVGCTPDHPYLWHGVPLPDLTGKLVPMGLVDYAGDPKPQLVPLLRGRTYHSTTYVKPISEIAAHSAMPEQVATKPFPFTLAFAMTPYKLQSRTLPFLNINLPRRPVPPYTAFVDFYVQTSRGKTFDSLRWLQCDEQAIEKLDSLQHDEYYVAWAGAYEKGVAGAGDIFRQELCETERREHILKINRAKYRAKVAEQRAELQRRAAAARAEKRQGAAQARAAKKRPRAAPVTQPSDSD
jgi:hypothetical protein